ncbi:MAG TPA: carboxypeptidase-like regulatory domain-containing protein, partial [Bryobacteraceae bacterium]|nr:carboxypeptidase-like regulatory domain-containing protein [Bryobacteraceae bacterium]
MSTATFATHFMGGLSLLALAASISSGQSTISGIVKDSTGAIIANATVEATSDVLIEKTRTVTTDSLGRYAIIDLRPGSYVVTVTQSGFAAMKQTVVVPANVTVPVDAELKPGTVAETVNVEAIPATVDVENVAHPETL